MIKEAYVSFDVAKLLKEKGFDENTSMVYMSYGDLCKCNRYDSIRNSNYNDITKNYFECTAPTHQMVMAWLREHGLHINAVISYDYSVDADGNEVDRWTFWLFEIFSSFSGNLIYTEEVNQYDSYEEAVEAALKYCLENLIWL